MPHPPTPPVEELLAVLDALPASVALWDDTVRLRYGNHRALDRFGRPHEALLGAHLSELVQAHAVELSARYIDGALAGHPQQVERAMVDAEGQRYNAHQVTHVPNVVDGVVRGYCALAVDITESIEGYALARRAREQAALRAERARIADDIDSHRVVDDLTASLERLGAAVDRASDAVPSLSSAGDAIGRAIDELRASLPARLSGIPHDDQALPVAFPNSAVPFDPAGPAGAGVPWPADLAGAGWSAEDARALLDLLPAAVTVWDSSFCCVFTNRAMLRWFGRDGLGDVVGTHAGDLLGRELFQANRPYAEAALRGEPQKVDRTVVHPAGLRHLQLTFVPWTRAGAQVGVGLFAVDVTPRVEAELALQDARARAAAARERERIADDLHNLVIQRLFAAGLAAMHPAAATTDAHLRAVQEGIVAALADLEAAVTTMREDAGSLDLLAALAHLVGDATRPHGIAAAIENVGSVEFVDPAVGAEVLAVAEAALSNVAQHSGATDVVVTIAADDTGVWLRVVDDGCGITGAPPGKGMSDMTARAARLGGTCTWRAAQPAGTVVDWRVPT